MVDGGAAVGLLGRGVGKSGSLYVSGTLRAVPWTVVEQPASTAVQLNTPATASRVFTLFSVRRLC